MAQELLSTFEEDLLSVTLKPGEQGGIFRISINGEPVFDRKEYGGFPEIKELKQKVRDIIEPERDLGHVDR